MAAPALLSAAMAGGAVGAIVNKVLGIAERAAGYAIATKLVLPKYEKLTLRDIVHEFIKEPDVQRKIDELFATDPAMRRTEHFIEFLKNFNIGLAKSSLKAGIISKDMGYVVSQLLNAISWSYGFGWLSWIGLSPILNNLLSRPADVTLRSQFPYRQLTRSDVERLFKQNKISEDTARMLLREIGYAPEDIEKIMTLAKEAKVEKDRDLSKSDITNAYIKGVINRTDALMMLRRLGYSSEEANIILELADERKDIGKSTRTRDLTYSQILNAYKYRVITREEAFKRLLQIGYDEEEANIILTVEEAKMAGTTKEKTRELSKSEILNLFENGLIGPDRAKELLINLGYDEEEADLLITLTMIKILQREGKL